MVEANRACALADEERLRSILQSWERSPEAVQRGDIEATRLWLTRRILQIEEQLNVCTAELAALKDTPKWKAMVDEAAGRGKDLVREMVSRLKRDIMVARNRLNAILWNPRPSGGTAEKAIPTERRQVLLKTASPFSATIFISRR